MAVHNTKGQTAEKAAKKLLKEEREERWTLKETRDMIFEKFRANLRVLRASKDQSGVILSGDIGLKSGKRLLDLEYGKGTPTMAETILIATYFEVSLDDLMSKTATITFK